MKFVIFIFIWLCCFGLVWSVLAAGAKPHPKPSYNTLPIKTAALVIASLCIVVGVVWACSS
jgi:hypothetical protein